MFDKHVIKQADPSSIGQRFGSWQGRLPKTESTIEAAQELVWQARNQAGWPFINRSEIWDLSWMDELANGFDESRTRNIESAIWAACFMFDERVIKPADPSLKDQRFGTWVGWVDYRHAVWDYKILLQISRTLKFESAIWSFHFMFDKHVIKQVDPSLIDQRFGTWVGQVDYKQALWDCEILLEISRTRNIESATWAACFMFDKHLIKQADPSSTGRRFGSWQERLPKTEWTVEAAQELVWQACNQAGWPFINRSEIWHLSWMDERANGFDESVRFRESYLLHVWQSCSQAGWPFINRSEIWDLSGTSWLQTSCMRLWDFVKDFAHKKHRVQFELLMSCLTSV